MPRRADTPNDHSDAIEPRQLHVLVVTDTAAVQDMFRVALRRGGRRVSMAAYADVLGPEPGRIEALAPDAIVLEFAVTAEGKGWQFLELLRGNLETVDVPVVLCTTPVGLAEARALRLEALGVRVTPPPCDADAVLAEIHRALGEAPSAERVEAVG